MLCADVPQEDYPIASQLRARATKLLQSKERKGASASSATSLAVSTEDAASTVAKAANPPPEPKVCVLCVV